jgi:hypothetical protein
VRTAERAAEASDNLDRQPFHLQHRIRHQCLGKDHRVVDRPKTELIADDRPGQGPNLRGADVEESKIGGASEIAARIEIA